MIRAIAALITMLGCTLMAWGQGEVRWLEQSHDYGTIQEVDGKVSTTMRLVNVGDSALVITRVQSTCGCTATEYTRHMIAPGDTGRVTLTYNPANRPGEFSKDVYVYTNGKPRRSRLTITGKVVGAPETVDHQYPVAAGSLRLEVANVPLGEVYRGKTRNAYINAYNASPDTLVASVAQGQPHVSLNVVPDTIAPGSAAAIVVHYDTRQAPLWGLNVDTLLVMSEALHNSPTAISGIARVYVMAQVLEDMSKLTPEQHEKAPVARLDGKSVDFDRIEAGSVTSRELTITNTGRGDLLVRRLWCPDRAVAVSNIPTRVKKGKQARVTITVDATKLDGSMLNAPLTIMTNDPIHPVQQIRLVGMVSKK